MKPMKIELKKLKIAEHMSEETTAFTADIFIDGKEAGYAKNDGHGGCTFYQHYPGKKFTSGGFTFDENAELIKKAEKFCLTLPEKKYDMGGGRSPLVIKMDLENFIDGLVEDELKKKDEKKLQKKMLNHIMWGVPGSNSYVQVKLPKPVASYPLPAIQKAIDTYKKDFKKGEVFLNTNLEVLGVKL